MKFYRLHLSSYRVYPKLHFLETHCLEWIEKYRFGLGLFSEQGSESLHHAIRLIEISCHSIPNNEKRMKSVFSKHLHQVCPELLNIFPKIEKRVKRKVV